MRKFLNTLPAGRVLAIAKDLGYMGGIQRQAINHIVWSAQAYRWTVADIRARYQI